MWLTRADPDQIHQVLMNLAINARDAMPGGGRLTLRTGNEQVRDTWVRHDSPVKAGRYIVLEMIDAGAGIPAADLNRIFDPFFTTKEPGKRTGLGLATAQAIVTNHGGYLTVDSTQGEGTSVRVYLPAAQDEASPDPGSNGLGKSERSVQSNGHGNGKRILVADDEDAIRTVVSMALELAGYTVVTAENGADALQCFTVNPDAVDLVILDSAMPIMDGNATLRAIRTLRPDARVVLSSGFLDAESEKNYTEAGTTAFLHKPYTSKDLLETVENVLATPPAARA